MKYIDEIRKMTKEGRQKIVEQEVGYIKAQIEKKASRGENLLCYKNVDFAEDLKKYFSKLGFKVKIITHVYEYCEDIKDIEIKG